MSLCLSIGRLPDPRKRAAKFAVVSLSVLARFTNKRNINQSSPAGTRGARCAGAREIASKAIAWGLRIESRNKWTSLSPR